MQYDDYVSRQQALIPTLAGSAQQAQIAFVDALFNRRSRYNLTRNGCVVPESGASGRRKSAFELGGTGSSRMDERLRNS
jgi:hypothetical protein